MVVVAREDDLRRMREILKRGWTEETSYDDDGWKKSPYKSYGQCYVTARTVNRVFEWEIIRIRIPGKGIDHYWNRIPDGREADFTSDQFGGDGIHKVEDWEGSPVRKDYRTINPRLRRYLRVVEGPLSRFKQELESSEIVKEDGGRR